MKKLLSILIGISLLSAMVIPFSSASRDAYHSYLMSTQSQSRNLRYFTDRLGDSKWFIQQAAQEAVNERSRYKSALIPNLRYPLGSKRNIYSGRSAVEQIGVLRPSTRRYTSLWQSALQRRIMVIKNLGGNKEVFQTYKNEAFSIQLPKGFNDSEEAGHLFTSADSELTISISKFAAKSCKRIEGFTACAIALSKNQNRLAVDGQGKLLTTSRIIRQSRLSDTVLNVPNIMTAVYTESFSAQYSGEEKYVSRYFVKDLDGGVYLIEIVSTVRGAKENVQISKQVFDSFRVYVVE